MQFQDFVFPHEPERLEISSANRLGVGHCPGYGPVIQELGVGERVISGEGAFFGPEAEDQYRRLEEVFFRQKPGRLVLPGKRAVTAHFSKLRWLGEGDGQVLRYAFEFLESPGPAWAGEEG